MSDQYFETDGLIAAMSAERERTLEKLANADAGNISRIQGIAEGIKTAIVVAQAHFDKIFEAEKRS